VTALTIRTAAKINLCLRVLGRRADGYHEIETVLHTVGLWDEIHLAETDSDTITLSSVSGEAPTDETNFCWQAASLLAARAKPKRGVVIKIEKTIPFRSGLGGGSSDAAATLVGLVRLWNLDLALDEVSGIAAEVGADIPFFLRGGCCLARGKGEKVTQLPDLSACLVLVAPARRISTSQAYVALKRGATRGGRRGTSRPVQRFLDALKQGDLPAVGSALHNDFESVAMAGVADALRAKQHLLDAGCLGAAMSGSGSAVFGLTADRQAAARMAAQLEGSWPWVAVVATVPSGSSMIIAEAEMF